MQIITYMDRNAELLVSGYHALRQNVSDYSPFKIRKPKHTCKNKSLELLLQLRVGLEAQNFAQPDHLRHGLHFLIHLFLILPGLGIRVDREFYCQLLKLVLGLGIGLELRPIL